MAVKMEEREERGVLDGGDLTGALHVLKFQLSPLTTSIILSSNKIQNGYILAPGNPGPPGKWPLKRRKYNVLQSA